MNKIVFITLLLFMSLLGKAQNSSHGEAWNEVDFVSKPFKHNLFQVDLSYNTISDTGKTRLYQYPGSYSIGLWHHYYPTSSIRLSTYFCWEHFYTMESQKEYKHERLRGVIFSQFNHKASRTTVSHRLALEYLSTEQTNETYKNIFRWRYRFRVIVPLNKSDMVKGAFYVFALDELYMNFKKSPGYIDLTRFHASLGYCITDNIQLEPGYVFMSMQNMSGGRTFTHVLQLTLCFNNIFEKYKSDD